MQNQVNRKLQNTVINIWQKMNREWGNWIRLWWRSLLATQGNTEPMVSKFPKFVVSPPKNQQPLCAHHWIQAFAFFQPFNVTITLVELIKSPPRSPLDIQWNSTLGWRQISACVVCITCRMGETLCWQSWLIPLQCWDTEGRCASIQRWSICPLPPGE